jgi:catecholate siderophore receptor
MAALTQLAFSGAAHSADENTLSEVTVRANAERAEGPVTGYRATRSATFTKTDTPLKEVPASVTVVPAELMRDQAMRGLADVVRYTPGVTALQGEGNRDQLSLRGNSTTADFFVDGIRDDAQIYRDLYNLERVEVLKGPGGMAFGRGGAGGVVNRVTKRPTFEHVGEANLTVGSYNQLRGAVDVGNKINDVAAWRLNAMSERGDSFRDGVELKRYGINPTLTLVPSAQTSITLGYEHFRDERTADRGFPQRNGAPFAADRSTFFGNADQSESRATVNAVSAVVDHDFGGGLQLRNSFRATQYDKFYQNVFPSGGTGVDAAGNMTLGAYNNANERTNIFNQTDITKKFTTGGLEHTLLAGVELGRQISDTTRNTGFFGSATSITVPASNPFAAATRFQPTASDANNKVTADIAAAYVQDQIAITKQWKVLAGVRYDHFKVNLDDRRATGASDLSRTDNEVSPRLGLIWQPDSRSTYYASYSYAFLPSGEQLGLATNTADIEPEQALNYEIGARWDLLPALELSAALFRLDKDNVRSADPANPGLLVRTGQQRTEGLEVGLQGDVTRNWQVFGGYAYLDGRITKPIGSPATPAGRKIGLVPEHTASIWNKFALGGGWSAGLGVIYQSGSYTSFTNTVKLPAFTRADGAIYYAFADGKTRLALNVENLFDKNYYPTAHSDNNISPGAPRNARLTLTRAF